MNLLSKGFLILLSALILNGAALAGGGAAAPSLSLQLDRREATLNDTVRLVLSVNGAGKADNPPQIPGMEAFYVTPGGTSSRIEMSGAGIRKSVDYVYYLQPRKRGRYVLGPAEMTVDGRMYTSNTLSLLVGDAAGKEDIPDRPVFLKVEIDPAGVYVEQPALYTLKLYLQSRVGDLSLALPEAEHLTFKQLAKPSEHQTTIQGNPYQVVELRYAVSAARTGLYTLPPARMQMTLYEQKGAPTRGFFDDPFLSFSRGRPVTVQSEPLELRVSPLPEEGRPDHFSGLVGDFEMEAGLAPSAVKAGESATLTVTVRGRGNVQRIPDLRVTPIEHVKIYSDQPVFESLADTLGPAASKTMKWALVPEKEGDYAVPVPILSFFDPEKGAYRTVEVPRLPLHVSPGTEAEARQSAGTPDSVSHSSGTRREVTEVGRDILPIHSSSEALHVDRAIPSNAWLAGLLLLGPALAVSLTALGLQLQRHSRPSESLARARKAARRFLQTCREGDGSADETLRALRDYMNDRFNLVLGSITAREAMHIMRTRGIAPETAEDLNAVFARLEHAVYTGKGGERSVSAERLEALIQQIEKELH